MLFIGDVHGKFDRYKKIIKSCTDSIQVGDMGVGFYKQLGDELYPCVNPPYDYMVKGNHRFIRGNHDNPEICKMHSQYIEDGYYDDNLGIMYIGGAFSIDKQYRIPGLSWWEGEELSIPKLCDLITEVAAIRPRIMVTHDCPEAISNVLFRKDVNIPSRTSQAYDQMFVIHKPDIWIFGHWHESRDMVIKGTRFICLAELEIKDIDV